MAVDLEKTVQEVRDRQLRHDEQMKGFRADMHEVKTAMFGNGRPGAMSRLQTVEATAHDPMKCEARQDIRDIKASVKTLKWVWGMIVAVIGAAAWLIDRAVAK
jgi:hypothetical protein